MSKNIWIWNHYATNMFFDKAGRHYWFAENLIKSGYRVTIFCASTNHFSGTKIDTNGFKYTKDLVNDISFVFVDTPEYKGNGKKRIINMLSFYRNIFLVAKQYSKENEKPDVIIASSVHPLTLVAGIQIAKRYSVPCICEIRDLWPESIVEYSSLRKNSLIAKALYLGEKWIYKKAHNIIFTIEGGCDYIKNQKWDESNGGPIDISKVHHINNGVNLIEFEENIKNNTYIDEDLDNPGIFKVVYAGSIRKANNLNLIIEAAKYVRNNSSSKIKFLIFGDGDEKAELEDKCKKENINNVIFKGRVNKKFVPSILSKSNLNILNYSNNEIWKYGGSQNKNFEYLASGKPILSTITMGYDIIKKYEAGITLSSQSPENIGKAVIFISKLSNEEYERMSRNARKAAEDYDFKVLSQKLISIIEGD